MRPSARTLRFRPLRGEVSVPGDKSISHRALVFAALGRGRSLIARPNLGDDVAATAAMLRALGAACALERDKAQAHIEACGRRGLREPAEVLDAGNSGTSLRVLLGVCAGIEGLSVLTGDASLRRRPMLRVVAPLRQMGAVIDGRRHGDLAPLSVRGGALAGIDVELSVASAQVKTALLLAGLFAEGTTSVSELRPSRDHTERMLAALGAELSCDETTVSITGTQDLEPFDLVVPGDVSAAMFLIVAATLVPRSDLSIAGVGLNPTRTAALDVLRRMGAAIDTETETTVLGEPIGRVHVRHAPLRATKIPADSVPALIDEVPALAVAASQAEGTTTFEGVGELRVKESDRIAAIVEGLRTLGATAEVSGDSLAVTGPARLSGGDIDSHGDHRIAMAFAVAGFVASAKVRVERWSCVDTSFPEFLEVVGDATRRK